MKNRKLHLAVIVSGVDEEYQNSIIAGIHSFAAKHHIDISHFIAFGGILGNQKHDIGEFNIFRLANFRLFDGAILLTNTIADASVVQEIVEKVQASGVPAVCVDNDFPGFYSIGINNKMAMEEMVEHFITEHHVRNMNYISGPTDNPDSRVRLQTYRRVLEKHGIPIEEDRIYTGSFRGKDGRDAVETFRNSDLPFPEAIICANDAMAISALITLNHLGIHVPDDVRVSGFDNTYNARNYSPELTSVDRPLFETGELACSLLFDHVNEKPQPRTHTLEMQPRFTESCGCSNHYCDNISHFKKHNYQILESNSVEVSLVNRMSCALVECDSFTEYIEVLKQFILETSCEEFYLCLCENWHSKFGGDQVFAGASVTETRIIEGYSDEIVVPLAYHDGEFRYHPNFSSGIMLPNLLEPTDRDRLYYFVPLHFRERCLGYFVIGNSDFPIRSSLFHSWAMNISNSLENIRKIVCLDTIVHELDKLYAIDSLTGIFNRNGFKRETDQMFNHCVETSKPIMVLFADMDGLKRINDTCGHKSGDIAIRTTASILEEACTDGEIACRFGGDEFIIFAADYSEQKARDLLSRIQTKFQVYNLSHDNSFLLNVSVGYHITIPQQTDTLFQLITVADKVMYEEKRKHRKSRYLKDPKEL